MTSLVNRIEERLEAAAGKTERPLGAYVIHVNNTPDLDKQLRAMAANEGLKRVNLCIGAPPKNYEIADSAEVTVILYSIGRRPQQEVIANFAFRKGEMDESDVDDIAKALSFVLRR